MILFVVINSSIKFSFVETKYLIGWGIILGAFVMLVYPYAMAQSQIQIEAMLKNTEILSNIAVLISLEAIVCISFCFVALMDLYKVDVDKKWLKILRYYPCILMFPILFYWLTQAMFSFTGVDFFLIAIGVAIISVLIFPALSYGIKIIIPEKDLRLEIHFLLSLFTTILGLISTTNGSVVYTPKDEEIYNIGLIITILGFVVLFFLGFLLNKFWWRFFSK